jgi:hypothetical protein
MLVIILSLTLMLLKSTYTFYPLTDFYSISQYRHTNLTPAAPRVNFSGGDVGVFFVGAWNKESTW